MIETATGLVLRTRPLTETSLIIQWLTPTLGRLATVAKGARRLKSSLHGKLDLFYLADFSFVRSRRSELHTLREVTLREAHNLLRQDLGRLEQAAYAAALIEQVTETETPLGAVFELLCGFLHQLQTGPPRPQLIFAFELRLLEELGLQPDLNQSRLSPGAQQLARAFAQNDWPVLARIIPDPAQRLELNRFLHHFLSYHLERIPKGRERAVARGIS